MKKSIFTISSLAAATIGFTSVSATAAVMLSYDSAGSATQLQIVGTTDTALVSAADAFTSIDGNGTIEAGLHGSQTQVQGPNGTGNDMHFRFGGNGTAISYSLTAANALTGFWVGTNFTAAQNITLDELSFDLFANSQNGSLYSARDVGLFASLDGGTSFTQFGALDLTSSTGNQNTSTFTDTLAVASGQEVQLRLLFTDKTSLASNLQASTRVGNLVISGTAVPEPSSTALLGLGGLALILRRRKS